MNSSYSRRVNDICTFPTTDHSSSRYASPQYLISSRVQCRLPGVCIDSLVSQNNNTWVVIVPFGVLRSTCEIRWGRCQAYSQDALDGVRWRYCGFCGASCVRSVFSGLCERMEDKMAKHAQDRWAAHVDPTLVILHSLEYSKDLTFFIR